MAADANNILPASNNTTIVVPMDRTVEGKILTTITEETIIVTRVGRHKKATILKVGVLTGIEEVHKNITRMTTTEVDRTEGKMVVAAAVADMTIDNSMIATVTEAQTTTIIVAVSEVAMVVIMKTLALAEEIGVVGSKTTMETEVGNPRTTMTIKVTTVEVVALTEGSKEVVVSMIPENMAGEEIITAAEAELLKIATAAEIDSERLKTTTWAGVDVKKTTKKLAEETGATEIGHPKTTMTTEEVLMEGSKVAVEGLTIAEATMAIQI